MDKYLKIEDRLDIFKKWTLVSSKLNNEKTPIELDENLSITNDISDFVERLREADGSMVLLKSQKGAFGFPFETILDNSRWFTKIMIYDMDYLCNPKCGFWNGENQTQIKEILKGYHKLNPEDKLKFHKRVLELKHISINTEHKVNTVMTNLVLNKTTPHICILYGATEFYQEKHEDIIKTIIKKYRSSEKDILLHLAKVIMTEWATLGELGDYIKANWIKWSKETWSVLLFQMLAMLALIQEKYPTFRHNDLSLSNILVQITRIKPLDETEYSGYYKYTIFGKTYCVPDIGFRVLLADFDYAIIKELDIMNNKVDNKFTKKYGAVSDFNQSFDCHMMLNWLSVWVLKLHNYNDFNKPPFNIAHIKDFIYEVIDNEFRGFNNRYINYTRLRNGKRVLEKVIPKNILENNSLFERFRNYDSWIEERTFIEEYNTK
jgi:hypothetical protein